MSTIEHYTDPAEKSYLQTFIFKTPYFAPGELTKIENYASAVHDNFIGWSIHHRLEVNDDGTPNMSRDDLILANLYYFRPASELIFLTRSEHSKLHMNVTKTKQAVVAESTKKKQSDAKLRANNTETRFAVVSEMVQRGETLGFTDYQFYRRYCARNGLDFTGAKVDKTGTIGRVDVPKVPSDKQNKPRRIDLTHQRYDDVVARLEAGEELPVKDYRFLRRYCARYQKDMPEITVRPNTCILRKFNKNNTEPVPPVGL